MTIVFLMYSILVFVSIRKDCDCRTSVYVLLLDLLFAVGFFGSFFLAFVAFFGLPFLVLGDLAAASDTLVFSCAWSRVDLGLY